MKLRFLIVLAVVALSACAPGRGMEAWRMLGDLSAGWGPSALKEATPAPRREAVAYRIENRSYAADLYRPGEPAKAALVLVPGAAPEGKDDRRLVAVAHTLARTRFVVLVPEIPNLRDLKVRPEDAQAVADALRHLVARPDAPGETVGLVAISYAAGPAIRAALREDTGEKARFLVAVGGYYDIAALVTFFTTGRYRERPDRPWRIGAPNTYGKWIFLKSNADRVESPGDRRRLKAIAERKLDDPDAAIGDLVAGLGPEGRDVHALLTNADPEAVPALIDRLPAGVRRDMVGLDLAGRDLTRLAAELILIHGRDDTVIPYTESRALAAAADPARTRLTLVDNLAHVDLGPADVFDSLRLWGAAYRVLSLRDEMARAAAE